MWRSIGRLFKTKFNLNRLGRVGVLTIVGLTLSLPSVINQNHLQRIFTQQ